MTLWPHSRSESAALVRWNGPICPHLTPWKWAALAAYKWENINPQTDGVTFTFHTILDACECLVSHVGLLAVSWTVAQQDPVHGIFQARILEQVAISYSRRSSQTRDRTCLSCTGHWEADSLPLSHLWSPNIGWVPLNTNRFSSLYGEIQHD